MPCSWRKWPLPGWSVGELDEPRQNPAAEQARRRRRRSVALALLLAALAVLFYLITVVRGPGILHS